MSQQKAKPLSRKQREIISRQCRAAINAYAKRTINRQQYSAIRASVIDVGGKELFERELAWYFTYQVEKGNPRGSF